MWDKARRLANLNNDAFTLVELMVAMAMIGIVTGSIYGIFISSNRSYYTQDSVVEAQQSVRVGINLMTRDIRMAGFDPLENSNAGIEVATATKLRFTADMNRANGIEETARERITFEYVAGNDNLLRRRLYEGTGSQTDWQTLINNVSALSFSYLDADGNDLGNPVAAADLESIKTLVISMTVEGENALGGTFTRTLNTRVLFMNLGL